MKTNKITTLILLLLLQVAVKAQTTTVNYTYDASGNRVSRTFVVQPIAPPQNNNNNTVVQSINSLINTASPDPSKGGEFDRVIVYLSLSVVEKFVNG